MFGLDDGEKFALGTSDEQRPWQAAYRSMIDAMTGKTAAEDAVVGHRYVGRSLPRNDVLYKVRGKARYAANISLPNMLHGCFVRSTHPYARIKRVDVAKARAMPGVQCVLTAQDIPEDRLYVGSLVHDTPILAKTIVRYVGEPIVAVAAEFAGDRGRGRAAGRRRIRAADADHDAGRGVAPRMRHGFTRMEMSPPICKRRVATLKQHWLQPTSWSRVSTKTPRSSTATSRRRPASRLWTRMVC